MEEKEEKSLLRELISYIKIFVCASVIAWLVSTYIIFNATIPSGSMENTIPTGSRVIGMRLSYLFTEPERGDIIIFKYPVDESTYYVKRIIGMPGDLVEIRDGKIFLNKSSVPLEENYLKEEWIIMNDGLSYQVPEGSYFVLGDNRNISLDARYWAQEALRSGVAATEEEALGYTFVSEDDIYAKAVLEYWPKVKQIE